MRRSWIVPAQAWPLNLFRPEDKTRFVPRSLPGFEHPHARLVEQIAGETVGVAVTGPGLKAEEWRAGSHPQPNVLKALVLHRDGRPGGVVERQRPARAIEEA